MDSSSGLSVDDKPSVDVKGKKCLDVGMASEEDIEKVFLLKMATTLL